MPDTATAAPTPQPAAPPSEPGVVRIPEPTNRSVNYDAFADIDRMAGKVTPPKPAAQTKPAPVEKPAPKPDEEIPDLVGEEPVAEAPKEQPKDEKAADATKAKQPAAELRKAYEELKRKHKELEERVSKQKEDPEKQTLAKAIEEREKRIKELEEETKFHDYERSQEYIDKYKKPYEDAAAAHTAKATKMLVPDGKDGKRPLTDQEFWKVVGVADDEAALELAESITGSPSKAALLVQMRNDITAKLEAGNKAKEQFRATAAERNKQLAEQTAKQRADHERVMSERAKMFTDLNKQAEEKYPHYFGKSDDEKANEYLAKGFALVDSVFGDTSQVPPEKLVKLHSAVRMRAAAFDRLAYQNNSLSKRVQDLEKQLAEYKQSGPGNGGVPGRAQPASDAPSWAAEIDAIASRNRR